MKNVLLLLAALSPASFAGWTPAALIRNSYYNVGCDTNAGTVEMCLAFSDAVQYCLISTDPLYQNASALADLSVSSAHPVQIYMGPTLTETFKYVDASGSCLTTSPRPKILGISIDKN